MTQGSLKELSEALRPFTLIALAYGAEDKDWDADDKISIRVSIGDLRRAVAAHSKANGEAA